MVQKYYFDTYSLIEIGKENPTYRKYKEGIKIILNRLNLMELAYFLIKEGKSDQVKMIFRSFSRYNVDYDEEILIKAAEMKFRFLKDRVSFIDCIGYLLSKKHSARFLTGDEFFRDKENVEFVK